MNPNTPHQLKKATHEERDFRSLKRKRYETPRERHRREWEEYLAAQREACLHTFNEPKVDSKTGEEFLTCNKCGVREDGRD